MSGFNRSCFKQTKLERAACHCKNFKSSAIVVGSTILILQQVLSYGRVTIWVVAFLFAGPTGLRSCRAFPCCHSHLGICCLIPCSRCDVCLMYPLSQWHQAVPFIFSSCFVTKYNFFLN